MARLKIPDRYKAALTLLMEMDEPTFEVLSSELHQAPLSVSDKEFSEKTFEKMARKYTQSDIVSLARALQALSTIRNSAEVSLETFSNDVTEAFSESNPGLEKVRLDTFKGRIQKALNAPTFSLEGKATSLIISDDHRYCKSRVVTDLRPVFNENLDDGPELMMLVHSLKLTYHEGDAKQRVFHLAMNGRDVAELRSVLDRAEAKAKSLRERVPQYPYWE
jgi:hypothetical protein